VESHRNDGTTTLSREIDRLFHPRSIAIPGVSSDPSRFNSGRRYLECLLEADFKGALYPINPNASDIGALRAYPSIRDIPGPVDYVISAVPARHGPQLVADCAAKGVRCINFFTSGFSEIEAEEGGRLEAEILDAARGAGVRILGPNCLGLYCPATGLSFILDFPADEGPAGVIAQSGGNAVYSIMEGQRRGVGCSKVVSYGNGADLNESDFLEYLAGDPDTEVIGAYIEGVKDGPRFAGVLKRAAREKPVIIYKGGLSESGRRTTASHTASIAGSSSAWQSLLRQSGAIQVQSVDEMIDMFLAFLRMPPPRGTKTVVIGAGGGTTTKAADDCSRAGLHLPALPAELRQKLKELNRGEVGRIFGNPIDIGLLIPPDRRLQAAAVLAAWDQADVLIMQVAFDHFGLVTRKDKEQMLGPCIENILDLRRLTDKPMAVVLHSYAAEHSREMAIEAHRRLRDAGFAVFPSLARAATAVREVIRYREWQQGQ